jgi:hypothetical protein
LGVNKACFRDSRHHHVASDDGARGAGIMYNLIEAARMNDVDPEA